jgi:hypothetical protein
VFSSTGVTASAALDVAGGSILTATTAADVAAASVSATRVDGEGGALDVIAKTVVVKAPLTADRYAQPGATALRVANDTVHLGPAVGTDLENSGAGIVVPGVPVDLPIGEQSDAYGHSLTWERNAGDFAADGTPQPPHMRPRWRLGGGCLAIETPDNADAVTSWFMAPYEHGAAPTLGLYHQTADGTVTLIQQFTASQGVDNGDGTITITFSLPTELAKYLGEAVSQPISTSNGIDQAITTTLTNGTLPKGIFIVDNTLTGTVQSVKAYAFTLQSATTEATRTTAFTQTTGITGVGGEFGPADAVVTGEAWNALTPNWLLTPGSGANRWWHSPPAGTGNDTEFTVTFPAPTRVTHVRLWRHAHAAGGAIQKVLIYGDGVLVAEYGRETRPPISDPVIGSGTTQGAWCAAFTELNDGATLAIASPTAYTAYRFYFPDLAYDNGTTSQMLSLGRIQLLDVPGNATVPVGMFLTPATFDAVPQFPSTDTPFTYQLPAGADVVYSLTRGGALPGWLTLTAEGLLSGQATTVDATTATGIRALTTAPGTFSYTSTSSVLNLKVVTAVVKAHPSQLIGYTDTQSVSAFGDFTQALE